MGNIGPGGSYSYVVRCCYCGAKMTNDLGQTVAVLPLSWRHIRGGGGNLLRRPLGTRNLGGNLLLCGNFLIGILVNGLHGLKYLNSAVMVDCQLVIEPGRVQQMGESVCFWVKM